MTPVYLSYEKKRFTLITLSEKRQELQHRIAQLQKHSIEQSALIEGIAIIDDITDDFIKSLSQDEKLRFMSEIKTLKYLQQNNLYEFRD